MLANLCWLIPGEASERDLERAVSIFSDAPFTLDGELYRVEHVSRDEQNRLLLHSAKVEESMEQEELVEEQEELLTVREVAERLRVDDTTVRRWIGWGKLEATILPSRGSRKVYRIKRVTLDALLARKQA